MLREWIIEPPADAGPANVELRIAAGDRVAKGEVIAIMEIDKATQEMQAEGDAIVKAIKKTPRGWALTIDEI